MWTLNRTSRLFSISSFVPTSFSRTSSTVLIQSELKSDSMRFIWVCESTGGRQEPSRVQQGEENLDRGFHRRRFSRWDGFKEQISAAWWQSSCDWVLVWRHWRSKLWSLAGSLLTGWANIKPRLIQGGARGVWPGHPVVAGRTRRTRRTSLTSHSLSQPSIALVPLVHWCGGSCRPGEHKHRQNQHWGHSPTPATQSVWELGTNTQLMFSRNLSESWWATLSKHLSSTDIYLITINNYISISSLNLYFLNPEFLDQIPSHSPHITIFLKLIISLWFIPMQRNYLNI